MKFPSISVVVLSSTLFIAVAAQTSSCSTQTKPKSCADQEGCVWGGRRDGCVEAPSTPAPIDAPTQAPSTTSAPSESWSPTGELGSLESSPSCIEGGYTCLQNSDYGVVDDSKWNMDMLLELVDPDLYKDIYINAREKVSSLISSKNYDNPGGTDTSNWSSQLCSNDYPAHLDDFHLCARDKYIDGDAGIIAQAGISYLWGNGLPAAGFLNVDPVDITAHVNIGAFETVLMHEMLHCLGFGNRWRGQGVLGTDRIRGRIVYKYEGAKGLDVWQNEWGCNGEPPFASDLVHWDESCMGYEVMTYMLNPAQYMPVSKLSAASMEDLGYTINYSSPTIDNSYTGGNTTCCSGSRRNLNDKHVGVPPPLSSESLAKAIAHGMSELESRKLPDEAKREMNDGVKYVGDKNIIIYYIENGFIYEVEVSA